ncbi:MAG: hypothetical protein KF729_20400 [Sandaracinaceae bacterium]|nr:hypothetical protein [Sandaracinaceae bacterium]
MRLLREFTLSVGAVGLVAIASCGGTDQQPEWPDPSIVDRSADDLGLPEPGGDESAESAEGGEDGGEETDAEPPPSPIRVVAGEHTAYEGRAPTLRILAPQNGATVRRGNVMLRVSLQRWSLAPDPGPHVHVIVDDEPYIAVRDVSQPIDLNALVQANLGHELAEGTHVVRVFPSRGHHESVKSAGAFATVTFHYRTATEGFSFDASAPLLTYSRPKGCSVRGQRLLLDFFVSNATLAEDGHRVRFRIDESIEGDITSWVPHFIENLPVGSHTIELTLLDASGAAVPGPFNAPRRVIRVADACD